MAQYLGLPLYYINVDEPELGMEAISFVSDPATDVQFLKFKENKKIEFSKDIEKREIFGPAIIVDQPIYRRGENGEEFYVCFSKETIEKIMVKYSKDNLFNSITLEHADKTNKAVLISMFLKDSEAGINPKYYEFVPEGSLFVRYKVLDDELWRQIKEDNDFSGFSIEVLCNLDKGPDDELDDYLD